MTLSWLASGTCVIDPLHRINTCCIKPFSLLLRDDREEEEEIRMVHHNVFQHTKTPHHFYTLFIHNTRILPALRLHSFMQIHAQKFCPTTFILCSFTTPQSCLPWGCIHSGRFTHRSSAPPLSYFVHSQYPNLACLEVACIQADSHGEVQYLLDW